MSDMHLTSIPCAALPQSALTDPTLSHKVVMGFFPDNLPGETGQHRASAGILYRREGWSDDATLLIQSATRPASVPDGARVIEFTPPIPRAGQPVGFRVAVNPIRRTRIDGRAVERALPTTEVPDWLAQKLDGALTVAGIIEHTRKTLHAGGRRLVIDTLTGLGDVTDPIALDYHCRHGVGRSKSYGAGLLTIAPV